MLSDIVLRAAEPNDLEDMIEVFNDAFSDGKWHSRCFPPSDPESAKGTAIYIGSGFTDTESHLVVAEDTSSGAPVVAGWARWIRRPVAGPGTESAPPILNEDMFPQTGDPRLAVRFLTATSEATRRYTEGRPFWALSTIAVRKSHQRRGIGGELMRFGLTRVDEDGWMAYLNAQPDGKALYRRFGFRTLDVQDFGLGITSSPMKREPGGEAGH
ncbi:acetyltransferase (GNAT) family domain-containing protein [Purpureocillium lilacinum]|uniref:Acetyltransferase (GNAT) family domain-containing protein n=2 Tax=Purpureocillium lilacinum TaxID=33203 RepID=A0A179GGH0_PURLI|nr:acetyltransferase (GNAT) family domain-containing protein [Purpureocillium lilacinum]OAQ76922.1 acetyltransferase (GNAT) family domain-containing protein [Purpureocillium lilacinum]PWI76892.1 hypothetical protein PCL_04086 [Purpureocillium lilacinum]